MDLNLIWIKFEIKMNLNLRLIWKWFEIWSEVEIKLGSEYEIDLKLM